MPHCAEYIYVHLFRPRYPRLDARSCRRRRRKYARVRSIECPSGSSIRYKRKKKRENPKRRIIARNVIGVGTSARRRGVFRRVEMPRAFADRGRRVVLVSDRRLRKASGFARRIPGGATFPPSVLRHALVLGGRENAVKRGSGRTNFLLAEFILAWIHLVVKQTVLLRRKNNRLGVEPLRLERRYKTALISHTFYGTLIHIQDRVYRVFVGNKLCCFSVESLVTRESA